MNPIRVQLSRKKGFKLPPNTIVVSRPSKWGNPFQVSDFAERADCVREFEAWLIHTNPGLEIYSRAKTELRGKNLACWCKIYEENGLRVPCHADVLLKIANA